MRQQFIGFLYGIYARIGFHTANDGTVLKSIHYRLRSMFGLDAPDQQTTSVDPQALRILVLCGIGDALWSFALIPALLSKYNKTKAHLVVHHNGDHRSGRSLEMLNRFAFVSGVSSYSWPIHKVCPIDKQGHLAYTIPEGPPRKAKHRKVFDYCLIVNSPLEHGQSLEDIAKQLDLDPNLVNYDVFRDYKESDEDVKAIEHLVGADREPYVVAYFGALADNTVQGLNYGALWSIDDWIELLERIHAKSGKRIILVGAPYDATYLAELCKRYTGHFAARYVNAIGQYSMPSTLAILRRADFVIGFASGVTISSTYLGTRTAIFWRPQEIPMSPLFEKHGFSEGFAKDWVPPFLLTSKKYLDLWYSKDTPESVDQRISEAGWYQ